MSVKQITGNNFSRATYNRFISGETELNSSSFFLLLENLHISYEELDYIRNGYMLNVENEIIKEIKCAFEKQDIEELLLLKTFCTTKKKSEQDVFCHLESYIELLVARTRKENIDIKTNKLYIYLINVETWTRYELNFFHTTLFFFDIDSVRVILARAVHNLDQLSDLQPYGNESFRLVINAIIFFFHNSALYDAEKYIMYLSKYTLPEDFVYERLLLKIFNNLHSLIILKVDNALSEIEHCIELLEYLGSTNIKKATEILVQEILSKYT